MMPNIRGWYVGPVVLLLAVGAGCGTPRVAEPEDPRVAPVRAGAASVVCVRTEERYVIVEGEHLPNAGHEATVIRDETPVGTVRFTDLRQGGYTAADIVEGVLQPGDRVLR